MIKNKSTGIKLKRILKSIMIQEGIIKESNGDFLKQIAEYCKYNRSNIFELCINLLEESNHKTDAKYLGRLFSQIEEAGNIEDTDFYSSGIV